MAERKIEDERRKTKDLSLGSSIFRLSSLKEHLVNGGRIKHDGDVVRLIIPPTTSAAYTDAQLDDYQHELGRTFINAPPQHLRLRARFSHSAGVMKGTAGFGFWNHPFTPEGGVIEPPRNVWFFYGSPESNMQLVRGIPGHGFKAAMLNTPLSTGEGQRVGAITTRILLAAGNLALKLPIASQLAMTAARRLVTAQEKLLDLDMTQWHDYEMDWLPEAAIFRVNREDVLRAPKPPRGMLGFVAWVDNYRATATPDGQYAFAYVDAPEEQWMEIMFT